MTIVLNTTVTGMTTVFTTVTGVDNSTEHHGDRNDNSTEYHSNSSGQQY